MRILGYEKAIDLFISEGNFLWPRFNTMLTVQTIFLGIMGLFITNNSDFLQSPTFLILFSFLGIVICILWFFMTQKGFTFLNFYIYAARELEDKIDNKDLKILKQANEFRKGKIISFSFSSNKDDVECLHCPTYIKVKTASYCLICIFFLIYLAIFVYGINLLIRGNRNIKYFHQKSNHHFHQKYKRRL